MKSIHGRLQGASRLNSVLHDALQHNLETCPCSGEEVVLIHKTTDAFVVWARLLAVLRLRSLL